MRARKTIFLLLLVTQSWLPASSSGNPLDNFALYSEIFPPFNYVENGETKGLSVDLLMEIFHRMGVSKTPADIVVAPWARGYSETLQRENTMLFSMARTPNREKSFKWVGPFGTTSDAIITLADKDIDKGNLNQYLFGIVNASPGEEKAAEAGINFKNLVQINNPKSAIRMLVRRRFDGWLYESNAAFWALHSLGYNSKDFKIAQKLKESHFYFAFNKNTNVILIANAQKVLSEIKSDGTYASIVAKYSDVLSFSSQLSRYDH